MVKLLDNYQANATAFKDAGIKVPEFDQATMQAVTKESPAWVHFGGGNLFRCFHSKIAQTLLNQNELKSGVIVAETYDDEVIDKAYHDYNNRFLCVIIYTNCNKSSIG